MESQGGKPKQDERRMSGSENLDFCKPMTAVAHIAALYGGEKEAKIRIADAMRSGLIRARAKHVWKTSGKGYKQSFRSEPAADVYRTKEFVGPLALIPPNRWLASEDWQKDMDAWRWRRRDFVITVSCLPRVKRTLYSGVELSRSDIVSVLGPKSVVAAGRKGRKPDQLLWRNFWHAIIQAAVEGRLSYDSFETKRELKRFVLKYMVLGLDPKRLDEELKEIWSKYGGRGGKATG